MTCTARDDRGRPCNVPTHGDDVLHRSGRGEDVHYWTETQEEQ